jgi:hypothetical protein
MRIRLVAALIGAVVLGVGCQHRVTVPQPYTGLAGAYRCDGHNRDGRPYSTELAIAALGDVFELRWSIGSRLQMHGLGVLIGDALSVALVTPDGVGVATYQVSARGGVLDGLWTFDGLMLPETCQRQGVPA